eukprot:5935856-Prymnesium_polylepis.1
MANVVTLHPEPYRAVSFALLAQQFGAVRQRRAEVVKQHAKRAMSKRSFSTRGNTLIELMEIDDQWQSSMRASAHCSRKSLMPSSQRKS